MASSSSGVRSWRTAFLTLRDETLTSPPPSALHSLIRDLILSQPIEDLAAAAADLPPHEVTSDVVLLVELALEVSECGDADESLLRICHLIHDVSCKVCLAVNSSLWTIMLNFLQKMIECKIGNANTSFYARNTSRMKSIAEILEITRLFDKGYRRNSSVSESVQLAEVLLCVVSCLHTELHTLYPPSGNHHSDVNAGTRKLRCNNIWEMQTTAFSMIGDALSRIGSSISKNLWQSLVEAIRKVMDFLAAKNLIIVDNIMSRFYTTLLHCLHLLLADPKDSLSGQVTGFGTTLQMFLMYGLSSRSSLVHVITDSKEKSANSPSPKLPEFRKSSTYVPPHLRRRGGTNRHHPDAQSSSDCDSSQYSLSSSDSDLSDTDGYALNGDQFRTSKARIAALVCIQDLCHAEPKSLTSLWTLLLPENDVLIPRKHQATLMTCLLFDPLMKIRMASASTLASMLNGHPSTFLQVAEYKESNKCGSFTTLSSSLGQILMQLHTGFIYLMQHETHSELLASLFRVLMLLISSTPYVRMPGNLLPTLIAQLRIKIKEGLACKIEHIGSLETALNCLGTALSVSPPSSHVLKMLEEDISRGPVQNQDSSVLSLLIQLSEEGGHPTVRFEAFQVLRAVSHNYPGLATLFWKNISATVYSALKLPRPDDSGYEPNSGSWRGDSGKSLESTLERCVMAALKVLDECLRAASGFKGADDLLECRLADIQLITESTRRKKISSAPSYELEEASSNGYFADCSSGSTQWCEVIEKHLPLALSHRSPMVRSAAVTCFAGMTSAVFSYLSKEKQEFVISCAVSAALNDGVPSVRSAACRAIGVVTCFSVIICSERVLNEFIHAVEFNSHDSSAAVRITACWALANICDSLRCRAMDLQLEGSKGRVYEYTVLLFESALRLTKDGDKVKSNAVRALGNLSRFMRFTCFSTASKEQKGLSDSYDSIKLPEFTQSIANKTSGSSTYSSSTSKSTFCLESFLLERIVHAFVSCVTTGNVKVQWNVCHALSNLFLNDTIKLQDMSWAPSVYSILLLLLRDATNYKIRIHAAVALAVPASRLDYGNSFCDVVQGLVHVVESLHSTQPSTPSIFKYKDNLEKQLMLTVSHVLGFASPNDEQVLKDFLIKKASFLEEWFKSRCSYFSEHNDQPSTSSTTPIENQDDGTIYNLPKKAMVLKINGAIKSLLDIYESSHNPNLAQRFEKLASYFIF